MLECLNILIVIKEFPIVVYTSPKNYFSILAFNNTSIPHYIRGKVELKIYTLNDTYTGRNHHHRR